MNNLLLLCYYQHVSKFGCTQTLQILYKDSSIIIYWFLYYKYVNGITSVEKLIITARFVKTVDVASPEKVEMLLVFINKVLLAFKLIEGTQTFAGLYKQQIVVNRFKEKQLN